MAFMVFWYKNENGGEPIYSVDARSTLITEAKLWSNQKNFGNRAKMRTNTKPAYLEINPVLPEDEGFYTCRVDFRNKPTKNHKINFTVIGKIILSKFYLFIFFFIFLLFVRIFSTPQKIDF